jgi:ADP-ribose pyrophosphatase
LGVAVFLSPGLCGEKIHVVHAEVDRSKRADVTSTEVVEKASTVEWWTLSDALARAARGEIEDCKTELALHRLRAHLERTRPGR